MKTRQARGQSGGVSASWRENKSSEYLSLFIDFSQAEESLALQITVCKAPFIFAPERYP